tara:strand:- start:5737 stop:6369 length:633 start_codon:yes stop_codon:yes gene_type:complete
MSKIDKNSKFYFEPKKPTFKEMLRNLKYTILFWKGRKKGMIHTRDLKWDDIRAIFFPKDFYEKYHYLGSVPYRESGDLFKAIYPLVLAMDYEAKPKWCPRWFLRFLHLFGSDNSIVRVRNRFLHDVERRLTKGILMWDYKTKWSHYDLRISISASSHLHSLSNGIERQFYKEGRENELVNEILKLDPNAPICRGSVSRLEKQLEELEQKK